MMVLRSLSLLCLLALAPAVEAGCKTTLAISDVAGVRLADPASTARALGPWNELPTEQPTDDRGRDADFSYSLVRTADGSQDARLFLHHGSVAGAVDEIEVRSADREKPARRIAAAEFKADRGITLGMQDTALVRRLGSCFRRERKTSGELVIHYKITDPKNQLLMRQGRPSYFARFVFKDKKLIRFRFGFDPV